jgi:hypothetical protein
MQLSKCNTKHAQRILNELAAGAGQVNSKKYRALREKCLR